MLRYICSVSVLCLTAVASAQTQISPDGVVAGHRLQLDNDALVFRDASDRWYTAGFRWTTISRSGEGLSLVESVARGMAPLLCASCERNVGWYIGQSIYTPQRISEPDPQPLDRPWAGWLYLGAIAAFTDTNRSGLVREAQQTVALDVGVVGPLSGAEFVQTTLHDLIGSAEARGWDNQLRNEPTLNVSYVSKWRIRGKDDSWDVLPHFGASLGNVMTQAHVGGTVRVGHDISGFSSTPAPRSEPFVGEWYVFLRGEAKAVAWNIFLDGNTFQAGPSVEKKPFVFDVSAGFSLRLAKHWRVTYSYVLRSQEFGPTSSSPDVIHRYGSITIAYEHR